MDTGRDGEPCTSCGEALIVREDARRGRVECPNCGEKFDADDVDDYDLGTSFDAD